MNFLGFVNLNFLIGIVNVFLLKVKISHGHPKAWKKKVAHACASYPYGVGMHACCCFYYVKTKKEGLLKSKILKA